MKQYTAERLALSNKIEKAIKDKGLNRVAFAHLMEVSPSIVTRWLSGGNNFEIMTLFEIEEKLGITLVDISMPKQEADLWKEAQEKADEYANCQDGKDKEENGANCGWYMQFLNQNYNLTKR